MDTGDVEKQSEQEAEEDESRNKRSRGQRKDSKACVPQPNTGTDDTAAHPVLGDGVEILEREHDGLCEALEPGLLEQATPPTPIDTSRGLISPTRRHSSTKI